MTAIYAGVSKDLNFGILASDDLESNYGRKVDKVFILGKKFAFAVTGLDTAAHAIREIAFFEYYSNIEIPTNIHDLAVLIGNTTLNICKRLKPHFKNDRHWHSLQRSSIGIVALDLKDLQLYFLEYGCPFHPERYYATPKIETKASGQLHFFALAKIGRASCRERV